MSRALEYLKMDLTDSDSIDISARKENLAKKIKEINDALETNEAANDLTPSTPDSSSGEVSIQSDPHSQPEQSCLSESDQGGDHDSSAEESGDERPASRPECETVASQTSRKVYRSVGTQNSFEGLVLREPSRRQRRGPAQDPPDFHLILWALCDLLGFQQSRRKFLRKEKNDPFTRRLYARGLEIVFTLLLLVFLAVATGWSDQELAGFAVLFFILGFACSKFVFKN